MSALKNSRRGSESLKGLNARQRNKPWDDKAHQKKRDETNRKSQDEK
jgi:hypothetical protein